MFFFHGLVLILKGTHTPAYYRVMKNWACIHITHLKKPSLLDAALRKSIFLQRSQWQEVRSRVVSEKGKSRSGHPLPRRNTCTPVCPFPIHTKIQVPGWGKMTRPNPITRTSSAVRPTPTILGEQVSSYVKHGQLGLAKSDLSESQTYRMLWAGWWK